MIIYYFVGQVSINSSNYRKRVNLVHIRFTPLSIEELNYLRDIPNTYNRTFKRTLILKYFYNIFRSN